MATAEDVLAKLDELKQFLGDLGEHVISGKKVKVVNGLSEIDGNLGLVSAGEFRAGNREVPGQGFSGVRIRYPAMVYDGEDWHVAGCDNDVLQFGLRASDGAALFGGGIAVIDRDGLKMVDGSGNPVFTVLTQNATINSESLGQGDVLIGDNSTDQPNMLWDDSEGSLFSRTGTVAAGEIGGGTFQQYGVSVLGEGSGTVNDIPGDSSNNTIDFDHATDHERYDDADFFDADGNTDRITIPTGFGGRYLIGAGGEWETSGSYAGHLHISKNGVEPFNPIQNVNASVETTMSAVHERELDAGDVIRLRVSQDSGSNKEFRFAFLWMHKTR